MRGRLLVLGLRSTDDFQKAIDEQIDHAVTRMRDERRDDEGNVRAAEAVMVYVMEAAVSEAKARGLAEVQGSAFLDVLRRLCPIWPFC